MLRTARVQAWVKALGLSFVALLFVVAIPHIQNFKAAAPIADSLRLTPIAITPSSADGGDVSLLFDRSTNTGVPVTADSEMTVTLEKPTEVTGIKFFGPAPCRETVKAEVNGQWETLDGLDRLNLTNLKEQWNSFTATNPVTTDKLLFACSTRKNSKAGEIKEIEVWGKATDVVTKSARDLLHAVEGALPPERAKETTATPSSASLGGEGGTDSADFVVANAYPTVAIRRAWLVYESIGAGHWVSIKRSINGGSSLGGAYQFASTAWSSQMEPIDPAGLLQGSNTIQFSVPDDTHEYQIRNLKLLVELDSGTNLVEQVEATPSTETNPASSLYDGDVNTGWTPYLSGASPKDTPTISLYFDKPTDVDRVKLSLRNSLKGKMDIAFYTGGKWSKSSVAPIQGQKLGAGENVIDIASGTGIEGLRFEFSNGAGSSAEITEIQPIGSGVGYTWGPAVHVAYPQAGEYYGKSAYVRAFIEPFDNGSGPAVVSVAGQTITTTDGSFEALVSKEQAGYGADAADAPWQFDIQAQYPDGQVLTKTVRLYDYGDESLVNGKNYSLAQLAKAESTGNPYVLEHDEGTLDLDGDAMDEPASTLSITSLSERDLPPLDPGMTNVTKGPRKGYRFGPHGKKFKKNIKIKLPYDKKKLPPGMTEADIRT